MEKQHNQFPEKGLLTIESIPFDILISIFSRLPVKSIARWSLLSKKWAYILRHRDFTDLYLKISSPRPRLLLNFQVNGNWFFFSVPQDQNSCLLAADRHMSFPTEHVSYRISPSVCGLVVCGLDRNHPWIYNPSTGQCIALPKTTSLGPTMDFSFGYDPIDKLYMVLRKSNDFRVFTLGTGEVSWRKIECSIPHWSVSHGEKCINGVVYYFAQRHGTRFQTPYMLVCFDIRFEKFKFLDVDSDIWGSTLVNFEGKLGIIILGDIVFFSGQTTKLVMWVLDDVQNEKWSKHIYQLPSLWTNLVGDNSLKVVGLTGTCEIVFSPYYIYQDPFYVIYYNVVKNTVRRAEIQLGVVPDNGLMVGTSVDHVENVKLMEVLRSS
ncbi:PREDICTED: F-box protein At3g49450-like [Camelina sativa]|uniref:F-box protein At3g49450-like n=1 Tax=Camelina sativa TaxID=90675 RepID=A0ABM0SKW2_CAMSA|nr:PREDICTED: F-box protein At3g49450-like [Camelina sativa]